MPDSNQHAVNQLLDAVQDGRLEAIVALLAPFANADKALLLEALPTQERQQVWQHISVADKGEVLLALHREVRQDLIRQTDNNILLEALSYMQMDELADLDEDLPNSVVQAMVDAMDSQARKGYDEVKEFPDDSAGGLMDVDATAIRAEVTLKAVLRYMRLIRSRHGQLPEHLDSLAVVDRDHQVLGVLKLSDLVSYSEDTQVRDIMVHDFPILQAAVSADEVAQLFEAKDLLSAPVVNQQQQLIGRITVDDVIDYIQEKSEKDLLSQAGLNADADMFAPIIKGSMRRATWLGINLLTAFAAAWIIGLFDASIEQLVALAVLMPVVASMGGVTGSQTLTIVTRGIAVGKIADSNIFPVTRNELTIASINAALWALVVFVIALLWYGDWQLGMVFGFALFCVIIAGTIAGAMIPLLLNKAGIDPAIAGGVILTTLTDAVGFFVFLGLATYILL